MENYTKLDLSFLSDQQIQGLNNCCENLLKWEKFQKDYEILKDRIEYHPSCISYEAMVPFGPKAFMPGKLIHTNEILVLLGENWFSQCSAIQATAIIDRRLKQCELTINKLKEEKKLLESWMKVTNEIRNESAVEIVEPYDEEKERIWKEKHKQSLRRWHIESKRVEEVEDDLVMKHLDELELNEIRSNELLDSEQSSSVLSVNHPSSNDTSLDRGTLSDGLVYSSPETILSDSQGIVTNDGDISILSEESVDSNLGATISASLGAASIEGGSFVLPTTSVSSTDSDHMKAFLGTVTLLPLNTISEVNTTVTSESDNLTDLSGQLGNDSLTESEESLSLGCLKSTKSSVKKHVNWGGGSEDEENTSATQIIYFSHTANNSSCDGGYAKNSGTLTPADLSRASLKPRKSILKSTSCGPNLVTDTTPLPQDNFIARADTAIADRVVERGSEELQVSNIHISSVDAPPRSISKFKANRKNKAR